MSEAKPVRYDHRRYDRRKVAAQFYGEEVS